MRITIAPGHGGQDPGAVGPTGLRESAVALEVSLRLERLLIAAGHIVKLTRTTNKFVALSEQAHISNMFDTDLFISVHCNAAENRAARGFEVWTTPGQTVSDQVAEEIFAAFGKAFPSEPGRRDLSDGDNDREASFAVLRLTRCPAVLVETGFISNPETEAAMRSPSWISAAAGAISTGVHNWIGKKVAHA